MGYAIFTTFIFYVRFSLRVIRCNRKLKLQIRKIKATRHKNEHLLKMNVREGRRNASKL